MAEENGHKSGGERGGLSRRAFLIGLSGLAVPVVAGLGIVGLRRTTLTPTLTVGVCDALAKRTASACVGPYAERGYEGLAAAVERDTGIRLVLRYYPFDGLLIDAARAGRVDAVFAKTWTVLRAARRSGRAFVRLAYGFDIQAMATAQDKDVVRGA